MVLQVGNRDAAGLASKILPSAVGATGVNANPRRLVHALKHLLSGCIGGAYPGKLWATVIADDGTKSAGEIVCTQANAAGNYVRFTYGTKTITLTEGTDFARGASDTTCGDALEDAINNHAVLGKLMTAANTTGTVALTAKVPTALIQDLAISTDDGTAFALTQFASATEGTAQFFLQHFPLNDTP
jgi:hypothetical protein